MHNYPSDISRSQFAIIAPILESSTTAPRVVDLYAVFCGILYVLKSGCQWRMMPKDYLNWSTCYYYFRCQSKIKDDKSESVFAEVLKKLVQEFRILDKEKTSVTIIDAQKRKKY